MVVESNGKVRFFDKRGHEVVELKDGFYEKYDIDGNRIELDLFGFEVEQLEND